jgi:Cys-tRNA(Pro)/Cys-tRNA(Cys) deacylase
MTIHTPITELLDAHHVPYRRLPHAEPVFTIETAAAQRGVVRDEMVKAILLREAAGQRRFVMACCLGDDRVDPKAVRAHLAGDWRRLTFARDDEISQVTTGVKGAVAPLALPESIPVIFDQAIARCTNVNISSGDVMLGLELAAADLIRLSRARLAPIADQGR